MKVCGVAVAMPQGQAGCLLVDRAIASVGTTRRALHVGWLPAKRLVQFADELADVAVVHPARAELAAHRRQHAGAAVGLDCAEAAERQPADLAGLLQVAVEGVGEREPGAFDCCAALIGMRGVAQGSAVPAASPRRPMVRWALRRCPASPNPVLPSAALARQPRPAWQPDERLIRVETAGAGQVAQRTASSAAVRTAAGERPRHSGRQTWRAQKRSATGKRWPAASSAKTGWRCRGIWYTSRASCMP